MPREKSGTIPSTRFFTPEQKEFLRNNYAGISHKELATLFNKKFGGAKTAKNIKDFCSKNGLKSTREYTEIHTSWLREHVPGKRWKEVVQLFNSTFNRCDTLDKVQEHCLRNKIYNGLKGGSVFHENMHITQVQGGYARIKIDGKWYNLSRIIWEKNYGKLSEDNLIIFSDGNKDNCSVNNLISVSRAEACIMNRKNLLFSNPELTKTGALIAKLLIKIKERKKELTDGERAVSC